MGKLLHLIQESCHIREVVNILKIVAMDQLTTQTRGQILEHCRVERCSYVTGRKVTWRLRDFATYATSHSLNYRSTHGSTLYDAVFSQSETTSTNVLHSCGPLNMMS